MSVEIIDRTSSKKVKVSNGGAMLTAQGPGYIGTAGGAYFGELSTNLATVISAGTQAGAGHIGQFRWASTTHTALIDYMRITFANVTDFTTLQRISLEVRTMSAHTASASGGTTDATNFIATVGVLTGDAFKLRAGYPTTQLTDFRMTDTADLTCGAGARWCARLREQPAVLAPHVGAVVGSHDRPASRDAGVEGGGQRRTRAPHGEHRPDAAQPCPVGRGGHGNGLARHRLARAAQR